MLVLTFPPQHGLRHFKAFDAAGEEVTLSRIEIMPAFSGSKARAECLFGDVLGPNDGAPVHSFALKLSGSTGQCQLLSQAEDVVPDFLAALKEDEEKTETPTHPPGTRRDITEVP